jgi:hypothetical protein
MALETDPALVVDEHPASWAIELDQHCRLFDA